MINSAVPSFTDEKLLLISGVRNRLFWLFVLACVAFGFTLAGTAGGRRLLNRR